MTSLGWAQCNYSLEMNDSFGDGWNGAEVVITVDGVATPYTFTTGLQQIDPVPVVAGNTIELNYTAGGSFPNEVSFLLLDSDGAVVFDNSTGALTADPSVVDFTGTASCPSCGAVSSVTTSNLTGMGVTLDYTAGAGNDSYLVEVYASGESAANGDTPVFSDPAVTTTAVNVSGLMAETAYDAYITGNCSTQGATSAIAGPIAFTTLCATIDAPYIQTFDTFTTGTLQDNLEGETNDCWTSPATTSDPQWAADTDGTGSSNTGPNSGSGGTGAYVYLETSGGAAGDQHVLISPQINLNTLTTPQLAFEYHMYGNNMGTLSVEIESGGITQQVWSLSGEQQTDTADAYITATVDLVGYTGVVQFRIVGTRGGGFRGDMAVDNFEIREAPACGDVSQVQTSGVTENSFDISYTTGNNNDDFLVEVYAAGESAAGGNTAVFTTNTAATFVSVSGLSPQTSYDIYVQGSCSGVATVLEGPASVTTLCAAFGLPFLETFAASSTPACWETSGSEPWNYSVSAGWAAAAATDHTPGGGTNYAWIDGSVPNGPNQISSLTTPFVDVSSLSEPTLRFFLYSVNADEPNSYNTLDVEVWDGSAWNNVLTNQADTGGWAEQLIPLDNLTITGPVQVRFTVAENAPGQPFYNDILIDDVELLERPVDNDDCATATVMTAPDAGAPSSEMATTIGATDSGAMNPCGATILQDVWFEVDLPVNGEYSITTTGNVGFAVYVNGCTALDTPPGGNGCGAANNIQNYSAGLHLIQAWTPVGGMPEDFTITVDLVQTLGDADVTAAGFNFFPNPTTGEVNLNAAGRIGTVSVMNMLGQTVATQQIDATTGSMDISALAAGTYFMQASVDGTIVTKRIVKQ